MCNIRIGYKILQNLHRLGVTYLSYAYDAQDKKYVFFSNNKWQKFYIKNDIQKFDPVRIASHSSVQLIRWDSLAGAKLSNELMKERENICNIHSGFSLVFKNLQKTEILSVVTDKYFKEIYSSLEKNIQTLLKARVITKEAAEIDIKYSQFIERKK